MLHPDITEPATEQWVQQLETQTRRAIENLLQGEPWVLDKSIISDGSEDTETQHKTLEELSRLLTQMAGEEEIDDTDLHDIQIILAYLSSTRRLKVFVAVEKSQAFDSGARLLQKVHASADRDHNPSDIFKSRSVEEAARQILKETVLHVLKQSALASLFSADRIARIARIAHDNS